MMIYFFTRYYYIYYSFDPREAKGPKNAGRRTTSRASNSKRAMSTTMWWSRKSTVKNNTSIIIFSPFFSLFICVHRFPKSSNGWYIYYLPSSSLSCGDHIDIISRTLSSVAPLSLLFQKVRKTPVLHHWCHAQATRRGQCPPLCDEVGSGL